jgi:hypothetical protein
MHLLKNYIIHSYTSTPVPLMKVSLFSLLDFSRKPLSYLRVSEVHPIQATKDLLILNLGARRGWVVSTTPRLLYPQERPGTHCTGGWVGPGPVWKCVKNLTPTGIRSLEHPAHSQSLY